MVELNLQNSSKTETAPGVLDLILDGDVPLRFQKHTRSLYQFFQNVYPTLYQFFKNIYPTLYQFSKNAYPILYQLKNCENRYRSLYQNHKNRYRSLYQNREKRYPSRWHVPVPKLCIVPPPPGRQHSVSISSITAVLIYGLHFALWPIRFSDSQRLQNAHKGLWVTMPLSAT